MYISESTLAKYNAGYMRASTVLKKYLPENTSLNDEMQRMKAEAKGQEKIDDYLLNDFTENKNFQWYTIRQCNLMLTHRVAEEKRTPPGNCIQTGQANRPNGLPYARIYTHKKTGRNYVVKTGY